jgi:REP element-mobilizing transposase RayT
MNWNLTSPPGFQRLRDDLPLKVYNQSLPHWRQDGATCFVTFRLHDSLPQSKLRELRLFRSEWELQHPPPRSNSRADELAREVMQRVERWLDQGMGSCLLGRPELAEFVVDALHKEDGTECELDCYVIMPNHVHAIVRPLNPKTVPLEKILQRCKGVSARAINSHRGQMGSVWQRESFDRIVRDEEHLYRIIQYIGRNPLNAGISPANTHLWIRPEWVARHWDFEPIAERPSSGSGGSRSGTDPFCEPRSIRVD